jgi:O-antigen/teichoic acid export membrane protein
MSDKSNSYKRIFKATSIFGGVQIFNIIIAIIRSKAVAVLLGPTGVGLSGLFQNATGLIGYIASFGLSNSGTKAIAEKEDKKEIVGVFFTLILLSGILGSIAAFILAEPLAVSTFGNNEYTSELRWLSITVLFNQLAAGFGTILTGHREIKKLAQMNVALGLLGLLVSLPLFWYLRKDGIVPSIWINAFISVVLGWFYVKKINYKRTFLVPVKEALNKGWELLRLGLLINLNGVLTLLVAYVIRVYISRKSGMEMVGLYTASFVILNTYFGMVFNAMSTDFYPSLVTQSKDITSRNKLLNRQIEIGLLLLSPLIVLFAIGSKIFIQALYSAEFLPIWGILVASLIGVFFKTIGWGFGYFYLACAQQRVYFRNELYFNGINLIFSLISFNYWGLNGMGAAYSLMYAIYSLVLAIIAISKYKVTISAELIRVGVIQGILVVLTIVLIWSKALLILPILLGLVSILFSSITIKKTLSLDRD